MIVGYNHNITYRGVCFHVQTEDSGVKSPHLTTLLYHGGSIISSQKTSYADILNIDNLESVVEDLAKEQHKGMLRRLKNGEFDQRILEFGIKIGAVRQPESVGAQPERSAAPSGRPETVPQTSPELPKQQADIVRPGKLSADKVPEQVAGKDHERVSDSTDLDDLIFSYLSGGDGNKAR